MESITATKKSSDSSNLLPACWQRALTAEFKADYFQQLKTFLKSEQQANAVIFPPMPLIFNAFALCPFEQVKVVILGQDPYHGVGQAHGLAFSVKQEVAPPPSLQNIFKELASDLACVHPGHGDLTAWAKQGILLLNTVLTVRQAEANSHRNKGWETFTDAVIKKISAEKENIVFVLWGAPAKAKEALIDSSKHLILNSAHPSPLSAYRGFLGCKHFSRINNYLFGQQQSTINWQLPLV